MAKATIATIDRREAEHFGKLARDWWDPKGSSAMLHRLNPARLGFIRAAVDAHWDGDGMSFAPLFTTHANLRSRVVDRAHP